MQQQRTRAAVSAHDNERHARGTHLTVGGAAGGDFTLVLQAEACGVRHVARGYTAKELHRNTALVPMATQSSQPYIQQ
jgi:hypothetical protein